MDPHISVRQAARTDTSAIADLLSNSSHIHRHLDWQTVLEWINYEPFYLLKQDNKLLGILACPPDPEGIAWIRCFACSPFFEHDTIWKILFSEIVKSHPLQNSTIYSVGLNDWFSQLLTSSGFENFQNIVVLTWNHHMPHPVPLNREIILRPMEVHDLEQVASVDEQAFERMWVNSPDKIRLAFEQSEHATVAEFEDCIVGYELSTANQFSAHLARIAVLPNSQHNHIAANMIMEMFAYFTRKGVHEITVNTQDNNYASLGLYKSMGFALNGEQFPVFRFPLPK